MILGGALRPASSNLPSPSLDGSGSGDLSADAGTIGVPTVTDADTSGGTSAGAAGGNAPLTQSNAPQPGAGSGGGSQPAPSNAPEVPSGDVPSPAGDAPAAPPADAPAAPPADGPAAPPADAPAAPPADGPTTPPADAPAARPADGPAAPPADAPAAPPADGPAAEASTTDAPASDVPAADAPGSDAPASDAPPADGTTSDAFGIPVVDLPNLPDVLPVASPTMTVDGGSATGAGAPHGGLSTTSSHAPDLDAPSRVDTDGDDVDPVVSDSDGADLGALPDPSGADTVDGADRRAPDPAEAATTTDAMISSDPADGRDDAGTAEPPAAPLTAEQFAELDPQSQYDYAMSEVAEGARTFPDNNAATAYGQLHWSDVRSVLTEAQIDATLDYTREIAGPSGITYSEINAALRAGPPFPDDVAQHITDIDAGMSRFALSETTVITRGTGVSHWSVLPVDAPGNRFDEASYLSTSLGDAAGAFKDKAVILHLSVPEGKPAMWVESVSAFGGSERELLLGRGQSWDATRAVMIDGQWHVFGRVVGDS